MRFKEGDKVVFLNEKGGGVVTRVVNDEIVHVSIEDGFEIPYAVGDLLKESGADGTDRPGGGSSGSTAGTKVRQQDKLKIPAHQADTVQPGIYLAMVPRNQEQPLASAMDFYLINHTPYNMFFTLFHNLDGRYRGIVAAQIEDSAKRHLGKVERTDVETWNHALVQALFFKEGKIEVIPPVSAHIVFKPVKIYKEESFQFSPLLHQKAMMVLISGH